jgi:Prophage minor tail protein Z (GPZ)
MPGASLTVSFDWKPFIAATNALKRPGLDRAVALTLVDTAKAANSKAASAIAKHTGLRVARVKQNLFYDKVRVGEYQVHLRATTRLIPLIEFGARPNRQGVRASKPWGRAQTFQSAFIATMPSGHRGVFRRVGKKRLPIKEMMGSSIHGSFAQPYVREIVTRTVKERLPILLARRVKQQMRKR